ncbi:MAG: hypothetical protein WCK31_03535 [bacterium]
MPESQRYLYTYNAYEPGLFGLQHEVSSVGKLGLEVSTYKELKETFRNLCDRLGERALSRMDPQNALVTPEPVSEELARYMMEIQGYDELPLLLDVGNKGADEVCERILENGNLMDNLRNWVKIGAKPLLTPRTYTTASIYLAEQLGIYHGHKTPLLLPNGENTPNLEGIYPTSNYLEAHPAEINNSKVLNYLIQDEVDKELGISLNPEGGVAYDIERIVEIVKLLERKGKEIMIKGDLSVDGMGNLHIDMRNDKYEELALERLDRDQLKEYIARKLGAKGIPLGESAGVVVTEYLREKIADPSYEVYSPPSNWNIQPFIYYSCGMIIENGGFAGSIIPDQMLGIPSELQGEYISAMNEVQKAIIAFSTKKWREGYVGISDCDAAICMNNEGHLYAKILEYNYNRETGGTASYHLLEKLGKGKGMVIARDTIEGPGYAYPIPVIRERIGKHGYKYGGIGGIILGHRINPLGETGKIMSLVYASNLEDALAYDKALRELALKS